MYRMKLLQKTRPLGPYSGPASKRPKSETPLMVWFRASGQTIYSLARAIGADPKTVYHWMYGQCIPELVYAFKIEAVTEGGVGVESWLGTELAKLQWQLCHADHDSMAARARKKSREYYYRKKKKERQYGKDTSTD